MATTAEGLTVMSETVTIPTRLLTLAEWDALGERGDIRNLELSEGRHRPGVTSA